MVQVVNNEYTYSMAPFNPNVNGQFYTDDSHRQVFANAFNDAIHRGKPIPVYDKYKLAGEPTLLGHLTNTSFTIVNDHGKPKIDHGMAVVKLTIPHPERYNPNEYVCGFAFDATQDECDKTLFKLNSMEYAVLIHHNDLQKKEAK